MTRSKYSFVNSIMWRSFFSMLMLLSTFATASISQTQPKKAEQLKVHYTCSMHPEVVSDTPGNCPKCGMKLIAKTMDTPNSSTEYVWRLHSEKYLMDLTIDPKTIVPGSSVKLTFIPRNNGGVTKPIELVDAHEKKMHLIVVDRDLTYFEHIHPLLNKDGSLSVKTKFPVGNYILFADVTPVGADHNQVFRFDLDAGDKTPDPSSQLGSQRLESLVDGYSVRLTPTPDALVSKKSTQLKLTINRDGASVTNLKPYLGAVGHMVIISEDTRGYLHTHPQGGESMPSMKGMSKCSAPGPDVSFHTLFPVGGKYKVWAQFNHNGKIHTADFIIDVKE